MSPPFVDRGRPRAARRRIAIDARHDFARGEGLHDIIVGAELDPQHAIDLVVARRQEQDRQIAGGAQPPAESRARPSAAC
jgi:hypothetical protein